jgi:hypothetical protein
MLLSRRGSGCPSPSINLSKSNALKILARAKIYLFLKTEIAFLHQKNKGRTREIYFFIPAFPVRLEKLSGLQQRDR